MSSNSVLDKFKSSPEKTAVSNPFGPRNILTTPANQIAASKLSIMQAMQTEANKASVGEALPIVLSISKDDVESVGSDLSRQVGQTTEKIIQRMSVSNFDELGKILVAVQAEADKLNPANYSRKGLLGWVKDKFTDLKSELTLQFSTAQKVFTDLEAKIADHIRVHTEWIKDLDQLDKENYDRYAGVLQVIKKLKSWQESVASQLQEWPQIDPTSTDAYLKMQARNDAEAVLSRIKIKLDYFERLKIILENNGPKIRSQQQTSLQTISTLKDVVEQAIPTLKAEFALFMQSLAAQKSDQLIQNARDLVNTTLQKGADTAKDAAIRSTTSANTSTFSTDTINHIRNRMLETVTEVKRIQVEGDAKRTQDSEYFKQSQAQYYAECVKAGAV